MERTYILLHIVAVLMLKCDTSSLFPISTKNPASSAPRTVSKFEAFRTNSVLIDVATN